jgi:HAD superfamily hydrolase (TIGR01509 family)
MPTSPLRAVVFDLDGLLFNTEELYQFVGSELMRRRGKTYDEELIHRVMGRPQPVALQMMIDWHGLDTTVETLAIETEQVFGEILRERLEFMPGASELLGALEAGNIPKAIATSSGPTFTRNVLGLRQLLPRFSFILTCEDVKCGKPDPEVYLHAAERFQISPTEMMVLEDSQNGCKAAIAAGAFAVAVPGPHNRGHEFPGASLVANTLADPRIYAALGLPASATDTAR